MLDGAWLKDTTIFASCHDDKDKPNIAKECTSYTCIKSIALAEELRFRILYVSILRSFWYPLTWIWPPCFCWSMISSAVSNTSGVFQNLGPWTFSENILWHQESQLDFGGAALILIASIRFFYIYIYIEILSERHQSTIGGSNFFSLF